VISSSYNPNPVRSRTPPGAEASTYRATREPPDRAVPTDPREIPYPVTLVHDESGEWVATIDALPGCNARGASPDEALDRVADAVAAWVEAAEREGKEVPDPKSAPSYSGRLLLRMPQTLHAELARVAERERVSLNQFITDALSGALGWRAPSREAAGVTRAVPTAGIEGGAVAPTGSKSRGITNTVFVVNGIVVALLAVVAIVVLVMALR
jgi:predicted RNase H-like HicB family nuclease